MNQDAEELYPQPGWTSEWPKAEQASDRRKAGVIIRALFRQTTNPNKHLNPWRTRWTKFGLGKRPPCSLQEIDLNNLQVDRLIF